MTPFTLLLNEEAYLTQEALESFRLQLRKQYPDFEELLFDASEKGLEELLTEIQSYSFFSNFRLIRVENPEKIKKADWEKVVETQQENPLCSLWVVSLKKDFFRDLAKRIQGLGETIECRKLKAREIPERLIQWAQAEGKKLSVSSARLFIDLLGEDLSFLRQQLTLLLLYVGEKSTIGTESITDLFSETSEKSVFALSKALSSEQLAEAIGLLNRLVLQGEAPVRLLGFLVRHYRLILKTKFLIRGLPASESGKNSLQELSQVLKLPSFVAQQYLEESRKLSWKKLIQIYRGLMKTDRGLKSSPLPAALQLDEFLWQTLGSFPHSAA